MKNIRIRTAALLLSVITLLAFMTGCASIRDTINEGIESIVSGISEEIGTLDLKEILGNIDLDSIGTIEIEGYGTFSPEDLTTLDLSQFGDADLGDLIHMIPKTDDTTAEEEPADITDEPQADPEPETQPEPKEEETTRKEETTAPEPEKIDENGSYTSKEDVALYIHTYGHLPSNFISKKDAEKLGWTGGSLEPYAPGKCIGGTYFGNYEGILPEKKGREYTECDIDTLGKKSRGAKRIVFSNDGLIYYTEDHYETFELLYGEE